MIQKINDLRRKIKEVASPVTKPVFNSMEKLGPKKCFVYGVVLAGLANYLRYTKIEEGPLKFAVYYMATVPATCTAELLLSAGGYMAARNGYLSIKNYCKKRIRARRIYNAWKTYPSYKTLENSVENA